MLTKVVSSLAFAGCLTMIASLPATPAQAATHYGHSASAASSQSPVQNIRWSEHYDRLVATSPAFRRTRMRVECGPITDPVLHQQCINSFQQEVQAWNDGQLPNMYQTALNDWSNGTVAYGSSAPPVSYPTSAGE
jgi:hypothetical protein